MIAAAADSAGAQSIHLALDHPGRVGDAGAVGLSPATIEFARRRMGLPGMRILNRCGFKTEFSLWSCDLDRGHAGPHHLPWDPRLPANLTREAQEAFRGGLLEDILERPNRRRGRGR